MRTGYVILLVPTVALGVMTGVVKGLSMAEEMALFRGAGVPDVGTWIFGAVQLLAALAMVHPTSRRVGAVVLTLSFLAATGVVVLNGLWVFAACSLLFPVMSGVFAVWPRQPARRDG